MKQMKKVLAGLLAIMLVATGLYVAPKKASEVQAAKTTATGEGLNLYQTEYEWYYSREKKLERLPDTFEVTYRLPVEGAYRPGTILGNGRYESSSTREPDCTFQIGFFQGIVPYLRVTDAQTLTSSAKENHGIGGHFYMFGEYEWPTGNVAPYVPSRADAAKDEALAKYVTQYDEYVAKFCTGDWVHLAIVNDVENNQMHCYVNGELFKTINECYTGSATFKTDYPLFVFGDRRGGNTQQFRGDIKNIALYSDARTVQEIASDKVEIKGSEEGLMAAYNLGLTSANETYPSAIYDISGNEFHIYDYMNDHFLSEAEKESFAPRMDYAYSMAIVGDPQIVTRDAAANSGDKGKLNQLYQWIVDNTEEKNIQFTFHMGDSTDSFARASTQWPKAKEAATVWNNAGIRYSMVRGNHDKIEDYLANYDWDTYKNKVDGSYDGNMLNTYQKFTVGDIKYLVVNLDFGAEDAVLEWACDVVEANPEYNVIVTTHGYLDDKGELLAPGQGSEPSKASGEGYARENDGIDIWNKFVSKYENIAMVLSGHIGTEKVVMNKREGKNGHMVTEMLINPQLTDRWIGLNGIVTMLYFSEDGKTVQVENYSVLRDAASNGGFAYYDIGKVAAMSGTGTLESHYTFTLDTVSNSVYEVANGAVALSYDVLDLTGDVPKSTLENYKDYLFAGWYTSPSCTMETAIKDGSKVTSASYAKFIPKESLSIKAQTAQTAESDGDYLMRFISSVEGLNYAQVGFEVSYEGLAKPKRNQTNTVYERIDSEFQSIAYEFGPKVVDTSSEYFVTAKMYADPDVLYTVRAYLVTLDGTVVYGPSRYLGATDGLSATSINMSFDAEDVSKYEVGKTCAVTYGQETTTATVIGMEGNTVHVRVQVANATALNSVTAFTFVGGESVAWRNLYTTHKTTTGVANADTSWYSVAKEVNPEQKEFVIATTADLYGLAELVNGGNTFLNQKIYLCAELTVNENTPENAHLLSSWDSYDADYEWTVIGSETRKFAGTFDGSGHTIQGLYFNKHVSYVGFFGHTAETAVLRDFSMRNSFYNGNTRVGTITGNGGGTIWGVYSDAVAWAGTATSSSGVGGFVGYASEDVSIEESEFAGTAEANTQYAGGFVGRANVANVYVQSIAFTGIAKSSRTSSGFGNLAGVCGFMEKDAGLVADEVVITGQIERSSFVTGGYGAVAGHLSSNGVEDVTATNVYIQDDFDATAYVGKDNSSGNTVNVPTTYTKQDLTGVLAYTTTNLSIRINSADENQDNIWGTRVNDGPTLYRFVDKTKALDVTASIKADTRWYTNPQGNVGTEAAPYLIKDADDFYGLVNLIDAGNTFAGKYIAFANDITFNTNTPEKADRLANWSGYQPQFALKSAGKGETVSAVTDMTGFAGTLDGKKNTLRGVYIKETTAFAGLFGHLMEGSTIQNLAYEDSYVEGLGNSGGLAGQGNGNLYHVTSNVVVVALTTSNTHYIGGFIGLATGTESSLQNCKFTGEVNVQNGGQALGAFIGNLVSSEVTISNGESTAYIYCKGGYAGGFVGNITESSVVDLTNCNFSGTIEGPQRNYGGFVGSAQKTSDIDILNCVSTGTVESSYSTATNGSALYLGGAIGSMKSGSNIDIQNTEIAGSVKVAENYTGSVVGGVGTIDYATVTMSKVLVSAEISASQQVAGFIGATGTSGNAIITMTDCHFAGSVEAFAPSGHLNAGILVGNASGYVASGTHKTVKITATRVLVTGSLSVERSNYAGKLVGKIQGNNSTLDCSGGVYIIQDSAKFPTIVTNYLNKTNHTGTGWAGTAGAGITEVATANMSGATAVTNLPLLQIGTGFESTSTWVAIKTGVPTLRLFAELDEIYIAE